MGDPKSLEQAMQFASQGFPNEIFAQPAFFPMQNMNNFNHMNYIQQINSNGFNAQGFDDYFMNFNNEGMSFPQFQSLQAPHNFIFGPDIPNLE